MSDRPQLLFVACEFFDYHLKIEKALQVQGWDVTRIPDRPKVNSLMKVIIRKARWAVEWWLDSYYEQQLKKLGKFDAVLIIKGESISPRTLETIRRSHMDGGPVTVYYWDSVRHVPGAKKLYPLADRVLTFDPVDAKNLKFELHPLFYQEAPPLEVVKPTLLVSFVGSIHSDRLAVCARVKETVGKLGSSFFFIYFASRLMWWYRQFFDPAWRKFKSSELSLQSLSRQEVEKVYCDSVAVLDVHHPGQTGLTIRTIESLAAGKKLITTNPTIREYEFYDEQQICVIDRYSPKIETKFFEGESMKVHPKIKALEINSWVKALISSSGVHAASTPVSQQGSTTT